MKEFDVTARSQEEGKIRPALEPSIPCPSPPPLTLLLLRSQSRSRGRSQRERRPRYPSSIRAVDIGRRLTLPSQSLSWNSLTSR